MDELKAIDRDKMRVTSNEVKDRCQFRVAGYEQPDKRN